MKVGTCSIFSCVAYSLIFLFLFLRMSCCVCFVRWFFRWVTVPASALLPPCSCSSLNPVVGGVWLPSQRTCRRSVNPRHLFIPPGDSSWCRMIPTSLYCLLVPAARRFLRSTSSWHFCDLCLPHTQLLTVILLSAFLFCSLGSSETSGICPLTVLLCKENII